MVEIIKHTEQVQWLDRFAERINELWAKWQPHDKQLEFLQALLVQRKQRNALEWGRRSGKSEVMVAAAGLWSQMYQGSQSYYFAPLLNQGAEILWRSQKIQSVLPENWIDEMLDGEKRVFWAGSTKRSSWLKIDGADKFDRRRGIEPKRGLLFLDEVREIPKEFWTVIEPTLARWESPAIFSSTPPDSLQDEDDPELPHWVIRLFDEIVRQPDGFYSHMTSLENPHLSAKWLEQKREQLIARGELDIWEREYLAKRTVKRTGRQFGMLRREQHLQTYGSMKAAIQQSPRDWDLYALADPAGASVWAWNLFAVNIYDRRIFVLDEIDCQDPQQMVVRLQWERIKSLMMEIYPDLDSWQIAYDDAETWFANELSDQCGITAYPAGKGKKSKFAGRSLLKDIILQNLIKWSERCTSTLWELENFVDESSRDHHVDLHRYLFTFAGYETKEEPRPKPEKTVALVSRTGVIRSEPTKNAARDWTRGVV